MSHKQNTLIAEDMQQRKEERALKNHILSIANEEKRKAEWNKHFPPSVVDGTDDWLLDAKVF